MSALRAALTSPPALVLLTAGAWLAARALQRRLGDRALANPILVGVALIIAGLWALDLPYAPYAEANRPLGLLLGPAIVALAVPLYRQLQALRQIAAPVGLALLGGALLGISSAWGLGWLLNLPDPLLRSLAPRSATSAIAMGVAAETGGSVELAAALVLVSGILGGVVGPGLLRQLGLGDERLVGVALGLSAHGVGTARALQISELAGALAGLSMGLCGLLTALLVPLWLRFVG
jgi:putative effector of murein hydrolase